MSINSFDEPMKLLQQDLTCQQMTMRKRISPVAKISVTLK